MSWMRRFSTSDPEIDPFNAPDPVMPGGEPEIEPVRERPDADDGIGRMRRRNERKEPGHREHRASLRRDRAEEAVPDDGGADSSPIEVESSPAAKPGGGRRARAAGMQPRAAAFKRAFPGAARFGGKGKRGGRIGCLRIAIILFIVASVLGAVGDGCAGILDDIFDGGASSSDSGYSYDDSGYDSDRYDIEYQLEADCEAGAAAEVEALLGSIAAGDEAYVASGVQRVEDTFASYFGLSPAEMGVDADALVRWQLSNMTYQVSSSYAYADPAFGGYALEGTVYFDLALPTLNDILYDLSDYIYYDLDYSSYDKVLAPGDTELIAAELERLKAEIEPWDTYQSIDYTGSAASDGSDIETEFDLDAFQDGFFAYAM